MSSSGVVEADLCCVNCGIVEVVEIKLEECTHCDLVKYCCDKCRGEHRQDNEECKNQAKEMHDKKLFRQPDESHHGECPLCFLPMPIDREKSTFYSCCCKLVCNGCDYADYISNGGDRCPFCREPVVDGKEENDKRTLKRAEANDPAAMTEMGLIRYHEGDYDSAFVFLTKAAELGDADAHNELGMMYWKGERVEKDEEKKVYHWEKAAIGGHPEARHNLGVYYEWENGNIDRAVKHFIIAANLGYEKSMKSLWKHYSKGNITKEDLEATLRTHKAAIDAMKSPQREAAAAWRKDNNLGA